MTDEPQPQPDLTLPEVLEILSQGEINEEYGLLRWSSNYAFLVSVCWQDTTLTAVYKPQRGERPLWDFPDGTLCTREYASFLTSEALRWQIVPPTALREGPRGTGTVQLYIDHDPEINYFTFDEAMLPQLARFAAFDYVVNNADRKGGHCLLDEDGHLWGIDHGITFHMAPKLRTVIWNFAGDAIPDSILHDLDCLASELGSADAPYRQQLGELLSSAEVNAAQARLRQLLKTRKYPTPGPGPNYPWPPV